MEAGKRWLWGAGLLAAAALAGLAAWSLREPVAYARIATGYAAKQTCSCLHLSGRTLDSCLADFPDDARAQISVKAEGQSVRASVLFGAISAEADHEEGFGCALRE